MPAGGVSAQPARGTEAAVRVAMVRRSLAHQWRMALAVAGAAAVATAALTGALLVGDSFGGSLRRLALSRLGGIDLAWSGETFLSAEQVTALAAHPELRRVATAVAPLIGVRGAARHAVSGQLASGVAAWGVDERFARLFAVPGGPEAVALPPAPLAGSLFAPVALSAALARELGARVGEEVLLSFERPSEVPRETLLGRREPDDALAMVRCTVAAVLQDDGAGGFGLEAGQGIRRNAFLPAEVLARAVDRPGRFNALVASVVPAPRGAEDGEAAGRALDHALAAVTDLETLGVRVRAGGARVTIESDRLVLSPALAAASLESAERLGAPAMRVLTYLADEMSAAGRSLPYSTVAALDPAAAAAFGGLTSVEGTAVRALADGEIALGAWAAEDLGASAGDAVEIAYLAPGAGDELERRSALLRVAAVVGPSGLGAERALAPALPGVTDAGDVAGWDPPFPLDLHRIRPRDEAYWDRWGPAPKAFVGEATGRRLWGSRFGDATAIWLAPPAGGSAAGLAAALGADLRRRLGAELFGGGFRPLRQQALAAAGGSTDYAALFLGFSLFLIAGAALLVMLLFALFVERRAREMGLLLAIGMPPGRLWRRFLAEGAILAAAGAAAGGALALAYATVLLRWMSGWWESHGPGGALSLVASGRGLGIGVGTSMALVLVAMALALRRLGRVPARALLGGMTATASPRGGRGLAWAAAAGVAGATALLASPGGSASPLRFFLAGAALCAAGACAFAAWARSTGPPVRLRPRLTGRWRLTLLSAARNPGRGVLCVSLVAAASFLLVAVTAQQHAPQDDLAGDGGTGGFTVVAEAAAPLRFDLQRPASFAAIGLTGTEMAAVAEAGLVPFRLRPGDDASCLNLHRPLEPRILGAPPSFVERGGFRFASAVAEVDNPWTLLHRDPAPAGEEPVPAIGDAASVRWILQRTLGDEVVVTDGAGQPLRLRIVALLEGSLFQSELLIAEADFLAHFPRAGGYRFLLAAPPLERAPELVRMLEERLGRWGLDAGLAAERLASYRRIERSYLDSFRVLGGLGLLLGTLGLGVVLARNVEERRGELAAMRAFGFRRSALAALVVGENVVLLATGLAVGAGAGAVAAAPRLAARGGDVPWVELAAMMAAVVLAGLAASAVAAAAALRAPLLPALKGE